MTWPEFVADIALCVLAVEMLVYTFTYAAGSPWWSTGLGRVYAVKSLLMTLVLGQNAISVVSEADYPGRHYVRMVIYVGGAIALLALWFVLRRYQREGKAMRAAVGDTRNRRQVWADAFRDWARRH
ncbi:putative phage holin [Mycolicibacterium goodii]|uniref:putative phage holin n=1 Tax=Mycolicibacterium goodii TaxID=134601 RepID=UPI00256F2534|nr:hypothetical protein [Mycolicibacterium goodii]